MSKRGEAWAERLEATACLLRSPIVNLPGGDYSISDTSTVDACVLFRFNIPILALVEEIRFWEYFILFIVQKWLTHCTPGQVPCFKVPFICLCYLLAASQKGYQLPPVALIENCSWVDLSTDTPWESHTLNILMYLWSRKYYFRRFFTSIHILILKIL